MAFLGEWGLEILLALIIAAVTGYAKYRADKLKDKLQKYEELLNNKQADDTVEIVENKLEPIYEELEDLRAYIRETQNIEKSHMTLIIASYRFRLIQLCKQFIKQAYMTPAQYDQLTEFYKLYVGLGGNGQAKEYYEKTIKLPIHEENE